jgi:cystathionine gamma-synthase
MTDIPVDPAWGPSTRAVWGGEDAAGPHGATVPPVYFGVTFAYDDLDEWHEVGAGRRAGHVYSRNTNPTTGRVRGEAARARGRRCGHQLRHGHGRHQQYAVRAARARQTRRVHSRHVRRSRIFTEYLPGYGVDVMLCDTGDTEALEREIARGCDLLYLETPTNPTLKVLDIAGLAARARAAGATTVVDNTFATPINQRPLELGADLVVYSATKYLGGHSDAMGGIVCGDADRVRTIFCFREINGASLDAMSAFLLTRGLKTLELRVLRQNDSALQIAAYLEQHPAVEQVFYPGLESHPHHDIARRQMQGYGGVLSFSLKGGPAAVRTLLGGLRLAHRAASLGSVGTLVGPPAVTSHVELTPAERAAAGIPESLVRYAVGVENTRDLIADLENALHLAARAPSVRRRPVARASSPWSWTAGEARGNSPGGADAPAGLALPPDRRRQGPEVGVRPGRRIEAGVSAGRGRGRPGSRACLGHRDRGRRPSRWRLLGWRTQGTAHPTAGN